MEEELRLTPNQAFFQRLIMILTAFSFLALAIVECALFLRERQEAMVFPAIRYGTAAFWVIFIVAAWTHIREFVSDPHTCVALGIATFLVGVSCGAHIASLPKLSHAINGALGIASFAFVTVRYRQWWQIKEVVPRQEATV